MSPGGTWEGHHADLQSAIKLKFYIWQLVDNLKPVKFFQTPTSVLTSTTTSTPLCTSRSNRYLSSLWVPIAAPHSSCLRESFDARGKSLFFFRSVRAIMDTREPSSFTMGSLPAGGDRRGSTEVHRYSEHDVLCYVQIFKQSDTSSSPFLLLWRISLASFSVTPAGATTRSSRFVITWWHMEGWGVF